MKTSKAIHPHLVVTLLNSVVLFMATAASAENPGASGGADHARINDVPKNIGDLRELERRIHRVIDRVQASVVAVGATGLIVSQDGCVLTCAHGGLDTGTVLPITLPDGGRLDGERRGSDAGQDVALFKTTTEGDLPFMDIGQPVRHRRLAACWPLSGHKKIRWRLALPAHCLEQYPVCSVPSSPCPGKASCGLFLLKRQVQLNEPD
ncbi:MAG: hypothetical protein O2856_15915 [Planctomycetota bacterium]|nr:hypothetical protein [Planctomycetota bacterium]